jgi:endonuclease-8
MPEGDTIWRTADRLRPALEGAELVRFEAPRLVGTRPRVGERIDTVRAVGKHLLMEFSGGLTLETHMRMTGSWQLYETGQRWRKPAHLLRASVEVPGWIAVCFAAPVVRTFPTARGQSVGSPIAHLGPDLCAAGADVDACVALMDRFDLGERSIGEVLLDQRIANGVGNVYKSEVCWACRVDPATPLAAVPADVRRELIERSARLLQANLGSGPRQTVVGGLAVYGRKGRACRRCGTPILVSRQGELARVTYWCPTCQPRLDRIDQVEVSEG